MKEWVCAWGRKKGIQPFFLPHLVIDMASEKWGKTFIFAKNPEGKKAVQWKRKGGEDG